MPRIPLVSAPYAGQSLIASGQERVNLYAEVSASTDPQAPVPITEYLTPGTSLFYKTNINTKVRGEYRTSIGTAYCVVGPNVFYIAYSPITNTAVLILIGSIADTPTQVYFKDNGLVVILVDGTSGYAIDMSSNAFAQIVDPSFYGADFVDLLDTFFIFNRPNTNQFYISASNASYGMLTNSAIASGVLSNGGAAYVNGTYVNIPLTGGLGTGATANIVVAGGIVTTLTIGNPGVGYTAGNALSVNNANLGGAGAGLVWTVSTLATAFDPLDIAAKSGFNDPITALITVHRELWLVGALTTEVWIGTGAADFYFQQVQGAYINHGSGSKYSIACQDVLVFFIQQDMQGNGLVLQGQGYDVTEISTPRVVKEFKSYTTIADAIGFCFQISDHAFYALIFPTANKGWLYDLTTKEWSEWNYADINGNLLRPRANCCMFAFGKIIVGDWENGNLLVLNPDVSTDYTNDNTQTNIIRIRTFPHQVAKNYQRVHYPSLDADISVGTIDAYERNPQISLSWSDDKGMTYGNPVMQSMGLKGEFLTTVSWSRLGMGRDRIFKLQWSENIPNLALNGVFIDPPLVSSS